MPPGGLGGGDGVTVDERRRLGDLGGDLGGDRIDGRRLGDGERFDGVGDGGSPSPSPVAASWSKGVKNQKMSSPSHGAATTASTSFFFGHRLSVSYSPSFSPNSWSIA